MELLIYLAQRTVNSIKMHLVPCKLGSVMAYLCDASVATVRLEIPKRQIDAVFIPSGKTIARLTELKIAYYLLLTIIFFWLTA